MGRGEYQLWSQSFLPRSMQPFCKRLGHCATCFVTKCLATIELVCTSLFRSSWSMIRKIKNKIIIRGEWKLQDFLTVQQVGKVKWTKKGITALKLEILLKALFKAKHCKKFKTLAQNIINKEKKPKLSLINMFPSRKKRLTCFSSARSDLLLPSMFL